MMQQREFSVMM